jgi:hypothetical protein
MGLLKETPKVYLGHRTKKGLGVHRTHLCAKPLISEKRDVQKNKTCKSSVTRPDACTRQKGIVGEHRLGDDYYMLWSQ